METKDIICIGDLKAGYIYFHQVKPINKGASYTFNVPTYP